MTRRAALMPRGQHHSCSYRHQRPVCGRDNRSYWWHVLNYLPTFRSGARFLIGYCFIAASKSESETKIGLQAHRYNFLCNRLQKYATRISSRVMLAGVRELFRVCILAAPVKMRVIRSGFTFIKLDGSY